MSENPQRFWESFYEHAWQARLNKMKEMRDAGENHPLRLISRFQSFERFYKIKWDGQRFEFTHRYNPGPISNIADPAQPDKLSVTSFLPNGYPINAQAAFLDMALQIPAYYLKQVHVFLAEYLEQGKFDAVVELGSGYAQNLVSLYYQGGPKIPYYAGEFTQSGTNCARMLAELDKEMRLIPFHFNHRQPDLSPVPRLKKLFVFTCHSLEQIDQVPETFFEAVARHAETVTCMHLEPFGYQIKEMLPSQMDQAQGDFFKKQGWNQNLYAMLLSCHRKGIISLQYVGKNLFGGDPSNPTSIAVWQNS